MGGGDGPGEGGGGEGGGGEGGGEGGGGEGGGGEGGGDGGGGDGGGGDGGGDGGGGDGGGGDGGGGDGDCLGDGIRSDSKDPSKYIITKNGDGTLTYKSDGYPDLKMTKKALKAADNLSGSFEGSVPFIIDVTADFDGSGAKADVDVNVKVASTRITCPGETIAET